ncbi:hypothetical protein SAMN04489760_12062 [Syntrophus gentianae]|uniref:Uncharacterized protein n=1 Tax=Syntrophus gentianae TaxID=43775 RepID=A0A1H7Z8P5_9BACT|nr:hypothetical protein [Syntrophus gentianae]SEM53918.1 hypothetical protein SAMN04489760_12062 [Syntrophus gentianae]
MDTEIIFWKAIDLEPACEMILTFATRNARESVLNSLEIRKQLMVKEYNLYEAEQISFEREDAENGQFLIRIMKNLKHPVP